MALFAAIELDEATRRIALDAIGTLDAAFPGLRFERPEKLHLTLAYLGPVAPDRALGFAQALDAAAACCAPFEITFDTLGAFGHSRRPHILALGCSQPQPGFTACAAAIRAAFSALGAHFENDAVAHVTLARANRGLAGVSRIEPPPPSVLAVREVVLFESIAAGPTTRYEKRSAARLRGRAA